MANAPQFFLYGDVPVKFERTPAGGLRVWVFDASTHAFFIDSTYRSRVLYDRDNLTRVVDEAEFTKHLQRLGVPQPA